jgi:alpha-L-fucosidase
MKTAHDPPAAPARPATTTTPVRPPAAPASAPSYLAGREAEWARDPRAARLAWFKDARYGLFLHYGVYSLLGRGEWVQFREDIPVAAYERLMDRFTAARFDAGAICDLALDAGMRYVNITTRHHDSFCLWDTSTTGFNSARAPARRDLVRELAEACATRGLGLFFYYSHGRDWRHPYFPPNEVLGRTARPHYDTPQPEYRWEQDEDTERYVEYCHAQLAELLTGYGPIAGIWLDGVGTYRQRPELFHLEDTYALIRRLQPGCLIAYKNGAIDDEDFYSPEHSLDWGGGLRGDPNRFAEINTSMHKLWGYYAGDDANHKGPDEVEQIVRAAWARGANLLLNTGPLGDGSIHPDDERTLREVGRRLREHAG